MSSEGRLIASVLMTAGVGLFATFSGFVAAWFLQPGRPAADAQMETLAEEVRALRSALGARADQ